MKKSFFVLGVAVAALTSCTNEEVVDMPQSRAIQFGTFVNHSTRSNVTETTDQTLKKFFVFGNYGEDTWTPVYTNVVVNGGKVGDQTTWTPELTAYWQANQKYKFGAYSNGGNKLDNANFDAQTQKLTFPNYTPNNNNDLIVAIPKTVNSNADPTANEKVGLSFQHMLSQVKFTFKNMDSHDYTMKISDIKVNAVKTATGTAIYREEKPTIEWETESATTNDYQFDDLEDIAEEVKGDSHSTTCFVIPQENQNLEVTFTATFSDTSSEIASSTFKGSLNYQGDHEGTETGEWTPGFKYNYTVTINGSIVDPDLQEQIIEFKVDVVDGWTDASDTTVTPEEQSAAGE